MRTFLALCLFLAIAFAEEPKQPPKKTVVKIIKNEKRSGLVDTCSPCMKFYNRSGNSPR